MKFTDILFDSAKQIWDKQLVHPFVKGIADGSLNENKFKNWVRQDYRYLIEFSRMFAYAAAKSNNLESMSWYAFGLNLTLNTEMQLHRDYAKRFDISETELEQVPMWPVTQAYTDFLIRTAADGDMADLVAALLPCAWGYVYIGQKMAEGEQPKDRRYADWITQYSSKEFADAAEWLKVEMNRLAEGITDEKRKRLIELFVVSSRYEYHFWDMCWEGEGWGV
jgi:thiaminase (transcriptional activator TenA)